jgi:hypothetical protein
MLVSELALVQAQARQMASSRQAKRQTSDKGSLSDITLTGR